MGCGRREACTIDDHGYDHRGCCRPQGGGRRAGTALGMDSICSVVVAVNRGSIGGRVELVYERYANTTTSRHVSHRFRALLGLAKSLSLKVAHDTQGAAEDAKVIPIHVFWPYQGVAIIATPIYVPVH